VFKQSGPVLLKIELGDAKSQISERLRFINEQLYRSCRVSQHLWSYFRTTVKGKIETAEKKANAAKAKVQEFQEKTLAAQQAAADAAAAE